MLVDKIHAILFVILIILTLSIVSLFFDGCVQQGRVVYFTDPNHIGTFDEYGKILKEQMDKSW